MIKTASCHHVRTSVRQSIAPIGDVVWLIHSTTLQVPGIFLVLVSIARFEHLLVDGIGLNNGVAKRPYSLPSLILLGIAIK